MVDRARQVICKAFFVVVAGNPDTPRTNTQANILLDFGLDWICPNMAQLD